MSYSEADLRDLAVARDIAYKSIRAAISEQAPWDPQWRDKFLDIAHLLAAALVRVQWSDQSHAPEHRWCPACNRSMAGGHFEGCLVGRALAAWMSGSVDS